MVPQPVPEALNTARLEQPGLFCTLYSAVEGPRTVTTIWRNIPCSSTFFHVHPQLTPSTIISIWEGCEEKLILIKKPKTQHRTEVCWMSDTLVMKCPGEKERTVSGRRVLQPFMVHQRKERCLGLWLWNRHIVLSVGHCCVIFCIWSLIRSSGLLTTACLLIL